MLYVDGCDLEPRTPGTRVSAGLPAHRHIENLVARYAELVDDGDFAGLGALLGDASFVGSSGPVTGSDAIRTMFENTVIIYADGTPRTRHVITNIIVDVDDAAGTAAARSYFTVLQSVDGRPLEIIAAGRYRDRFLLRDKEWRFAERRVQVEFAGDVSRHLRSHQITRHDH
ncbi:nuclear transport factor 2 family protein [Nonomuraea sp. NPDC050691]|uniref:nuclear transport factor 2 family protein n=1 Tax=Nonomuraea sp. NPDC050691 TaxID=3155661 RepID=UPI0033D272D3